jgi:N,N'-diacetyllegionaminate synthase
MIDLKNLDVGRPLLIAEIGGNHEGDVGEAYELARLAAEHGADVVKFQTYTAEGLVNPVVAADRFGHFRRFEVPAEEWPKLADYVRSLGAQWMTSLWDADLFDLIEPLQPAFKVGSGDLTNLPLLARMVDTGKPLILSTAMSTLADVQRTVGFLVGRDPALLADRRLGLLQCTAMYDDPDSLETNLAVMETFRTVFPGAVVGYSNHHTGLDACHAALALGAGILEVHFTNDRDREFRDHRLSLLPNELARLRALCERVPRLVGYRDKTVSAVEADLVRGFRRAVYARHDLEPGTVVTEGDLVVLRPEEGIPASRYYDVVGRRALEPIGAFQPLSLAQFG